MKSLQLTYPFLNCQLPDNVTYLQIGIQNPYNIPITELLENNSMYIPVKIKNKEYTITDKDILEFSDIHFRGTNLISLNSNNKYIIADIVYETAD